MFEVIWLDKWIIFWIRWFQTDATARFGSHQEWIHGKALFECIVPKVIFKYLQSSPFRISISILKFGFVWIISGIRWFQTDLTARFGSHQEWIHGKALFECIVPKVSNLQIPESFEVRLEYQFQIWFWFVFLSHKSDKKVLPTDSVLQKKALNSNLNCNLFIYSYSQPWW